MKRSKKIRCRDNNTKTCKISKEKKAISDSGVKNYPFHVFVGAYSFTFSLFTSWYYLVLILRLFCVGVRTLLDQSSMFVGKKKKEYSRKKGTAVFFI